MFHLRFYLINLFEYKKLCIILVKIKNVISFYRFNIFLIVPNI